MGRGVLEMGKKTLVVGMGEVGSSLYNVLSARYSICAYDIDPTKMHGRSYVRDDTDVDFMHICIPYHSSGGFLAAVREYQDMYNPDYTVINSTVSPGTSDALGACHSPVVGIHPKLEEGIRTFTKFCGGANADVVANYFRKAGLHVYICREAKTTEIAKIMSTTYYATCIEFVKEVERVCLEYGVPFSEAFTLWQQDYNRGYTRLQREELARPVLVPVQGRQGGHCTLPNVDLLHTNFGELVKELNKEENDETKSRN